MDGISVVDSAERSRFEAVTADGGLAGFADYLRADDRVVMPHTVVRPDLRGGGVASALVEAALDDALERGLPVVPACSFVRAYLERHPERAHQVAG